MCASIQVYTHLYFYLYWKWWALTVTIYFCLAPQNSFYPPPSVSVTLSLSIIILSSIHIVCLSSSFLFIVEFYSIKRIYHNFRKLPGFPPKVIVQFYIPTSSLRKFWFLHIIAKLWVLSVFLTSYFVIGTWWYLLWF